MKSHQSKSKTILSCLLVAELVLAPPWAFCMEVRANMVRYSSLPKIMLRVLRGGAELIGYADGSQLCHYAPRESPHIFVRWVTVNSQVLQNNLTTFLVVLVVVLFLLLPQLHSLRS